MNDDFWEHLDRLIAQSRIVIDPLKVSHHRRFPEIVYPLDYGTLEGTTADDGGGIDLYLGSRESRDLSAVILSVDMLKRDAEIKLVLGCTKEETQIALDQLNSGRMRALLIARPRRKHEIHS
jgi:inorganic pyrophosphatase